MTARRSARVCGLCCVVLRDAMRRCDEVSVRCQVIRHKLVDMAMRLNSTRAFLNATGQARARHMPAPCVGIIMAASRVCRGVSIAPSRCRVTVRLPWLAGGDGGRGRGVGDLPAEEPRHLQPRVHRLRGRADPRRHGARATAFTHIHHPAAAGPSAAPARRYMEGTASERIFRETKVMSIGGGASEIMKDLAARQSGY